MSSIGLVSLLVAFCAAFFSVIALLAGYIVGKRKPRSNLPETLSWGGRVATFLAAASLTVSCGVLVVCFFTGNISIQYVLDQHSHSSSPLFKLAGLWAGREGSLLLWAWLISIFNSIVALRRMKKMEELDNMAIFVGQVVLVIFVGIMLFSEENMPFIVTADSYFDSDGSLTMAAQLLGMSSLLEHWAMAIHPPTLFVGYAGLTVPFAYAISACIVNEPSTLWVERSERFALVSWVFLSIGIGLGAVWAYVVLGWGGYWGWDPVENASLLSWLVCVALIHSFTVYRRRNGFKCWAVVCACLAFSFCIVGTFISRSGLVQSVHAFEGDPMSLVLFGLLIIGSFLVGIVACVVRRKSFAAEPVDVESMVSKDGAYFVNNLVMLVLSFLLLYLTLSNSLPSFLPFGGQSVASGAYNAIARPVGVVYLLMMAACPLLSWGKTSPKEFFKKARIPGVCALVLFAVLMVYLVTYLVPAYQGTVAAGGSEAELLAEQGPAAYYFILTGLAFFTASVLLFNSLFQLVRLLGLGKDGVKDGERLPKCRIAMLGSSLSHLAMAVILVGLVGSSMYVTTVSGYVAYDSDNNTCSETFKIKDYELVFTGSSAAQAENGMDVLYTTEFDVKKDGETIGHVAPQVQLVMTTQQQKLNAAVVSLPTEDLFVIYKGMNESEDALSLEVRVNPLIGLVWVGLVLLCTGMFLSCLGRRKPVAVEENLTLAELGAREAKRDE